MCACACELEREFACAWQCTQEYTQKCTSFYLHIHVHQECTCACESAYTSSCAHIPLRQPHHPSSLFLAAQCSLSLPFSRPTHSKAVSPFPLPPDRLLSLPLITLTFPFHTVTLPPPPSLPTWSCVYVCVCFYFFYYYYFCLL